MAGKVQTPLGYLLDLFGIGLSELSDYLNIEKTSVSKWKTGARTLKPGSPYFSDVIDFFLLNGRFDRVLREEMRRFYPDKSADLRTLLGDFFSEKSLVPTAFGILDGGFASKGRTEIFVFEGGGGAALSVVAGYAESLGSACRISLMDSDNFCRLADDSSADGVSKVLFSLLERGFTVRFIFCGHDCVASSLLTAESFASVFAHAGCEIVYAPDYRDCGLRLSLFVVHEKIAAATCEPDGCAATTSVFTDALSLAQYGALADVAAVGGKNTFELYGMSGIGFDRYRDALSGVLSEPFYYASPLLPIFSMSEELLENILLSNNVQQSKVAKVFDFRRFYTEPLYNKNCASLCSLVPVAGLRAALSSQEHLNYELSALTGEKITVTKKQTLEHIDCTRELLRTSKGFHLYPMQMSDSAAWGGSVFFCKRNVCMGYLGAESSCIKLTRESFFVEQAVREIDSRLSTLTRELRSSRYVAGALERLADEYR